MAALVVTGGSPGHPIFIYMAMEDLIPIADLFEAHLTVSELDRAVAFYKDLLGLPLARLFPERKVAFFLDWRSRQGDARSLGGGNHADEYQPPCGLPGCTL